jgi:hypothetical protein
VQCCAQYSTTFFILDVVKGGRSIFFDKLVAHALSSFS